MILWFRLTLRVSRFVTEDTNPVVSIDPVGLPASSGVGGRATIAWYRCNKSFLRLVSPFAHPCARSTTAAQRRDSGPPLGPRSRATIGPLLLPCSNSRSNAASPITPPLVASSSWRVSASRLPASLLASHEAMTRIESSHAHRKWNDICFPGRTKQEVLSAASKDGFTAARKTNAFHDSRTLMCYFCCTASSALALASARAVL
jgi:hypothetical protein